MLVSTSRLICIDLACATIRLAHGTGRTWFASVQPRACARVLGPCNQDTESIMIKKVFVAATLAFGTASIAVPATAQLQTQGGLVNVAVGDVTLLNNFLNDTQIAAAY